jgi:hypothetical protein
MKSLVEKTDTIEGLSRHAGLILACIKYIPSKQISYKNLRNLYDEFHQKAIDLGETKSWFNLPEDLDTAKSKLAKDTVNNFKNSIFLIKL